MKKSTLIILALIILVIIVAGVFLKLNHCFSDCDKESSLVGGCAGVSLEYRQECCNNWAQENEIVHVQCVGEWTINDENVCAWKCE